MIFRGSFLLYRKSCEQDSTALTRGVDPLTLNGLVQLNDGNWYYMENCELSDKGSYYIDQKGCSISIIYTYNVVDGLVTAMQAEVHTIQ